MILCKQRGSNFFHSTPCYLTSSIYNDSNIVVESKQPNMDVQFLDSKKMFFFLRYNSRKKLS